MPKKLIIVRHAETDWNFKRMVQGWMDVPLNEKGRFQARMVSNRLKLIKIDYIFSSDQKRAIETAKIIAKPHGVKVVIRKELRERGMGKFEGRKGEELKKIIPDIEKRMREERIDWKKYKAEENAALKKRIAVFFNFLKRFEDKNVVVVTHGQVKRGMFRILGCEEEVKEGVNFVNTSVTVFKKDKDRRYRLTVLADGSHLFLG